MADVLGPIVAELACRRAALLQSVAVRDPVGGVDLGHFPALSRLVQRLRSLSQGAIAVALNGVAILMNLEKRQARTC